MPIFLAGLQQFDGAAGLERQGHADGNDGVGLDARAEGAANGHFFDIDLIERNVKNLAQ